MKGVAHGRRRPRWKDAEALTFATDHDLVVCLPVHSPRYCSLVTCVANMASPPPGEDVFTHNLAIKLSRALNIVNPNDLLARRVQDIAKTNSVDGFISGMVPAML